MAHRPKHEMQNHNTPVAVQSLNPVWLCNPMNCSMPDFPVLSHSVMSSSLQSMDCSPPGSSVHGDSPGKITERVAIPFSRGSSQPRDQTQFSCITSKFFTVWATGKIRSLISEDKISVFNEGPLKQLISHGQFFNSTPIPIFLALFEKMWDH